MRSLGVNLRGFLIIDAIVLLLQQEMALLPQILWNCSKTSIRNTMACNLQVCNLSRRPDRVAYTTDCKRVVRRWWA